MCETLQRAELVFEDCPLPFKERGLFLKTIDSVSKKDLQSLAMHGKWANKDLVAVFLTAVGYV